ncbi:MAG: SPOR domain-containing protein [Nitrosomonas sp.]|nr:MAG: SPOR domain-containing protein [Nitrosomonas sp.]
MSKNVSEEELLLRKRARRRLVGAIVLVVFSVIVLPIIFDEPKPDNEQHEIAINLPAPGKNSQAEIAMIPPKQEFSEQGAADNEHPFSGWQEESKNKPLDDLEAMEEFSEQKRIPIPGIKPKNESKPAAETRNIAAIAATNPADSKSISGSKPAAAEISKEFVVQLGAFSDQGKAKQQVENLIFNGFKPYTETLKTGSGEVTRVRIGSFPTRAAAENEIKKLKNAGFDGVVTIK